MRTRTHALAVAGVVAAVILSFEVSEAAGTCWLGGHLYNRNRQIAEGGVINVECPGGIHSAPFGNWGVDSRFGSIKNEDQFAGWYDDDDKWQWNSCTTHEDYDAPHPRYFNRPIQGPRVWQETSRGEERVNSAWFDRGSRGQTCRARWENKVYTFSDLTIWLYELDWDGNDEVAEVDYGDVRIRLSCSNNWDCESDSGWIDEDSIDPSNTKISFESYVLLSTEAK